MRFIRACYTPSFGKYNPFSSYLVTTTGNGTVKPPPFIGIRLDSFTESFKEEPFPLSRQLP
ncbi:hypothetical protein HMPREF3038_02757 [Akkermansia sp. KLE1797]|nr:hypothetical protein HMPREF3038_02757 [Akkermansia sp. KLE1797]KZA03781.1 hypothetical protein HMPREF1326_02554 [Akkermansia sp. KLE1605]